MVGIFTKKWFSFCVKMLLKIIVFVNISEKIFEKIWNFCENICDFPNIVKSWPPVLSVLSRIPNQLVQSYPFPMFCPSCPVSDVLSMLSCCPLFWPVCPVPAVLSKVSYSSCPAQASFSIALLTLLCPGSPVLSVPLSRLSFSVLAIITSVSYPVCTIPTVFSGCPFPSFLSWLSCPGCLSQLPDPATLPTAFLMSLSCHWCHVLACPLCPIQAQLSRLTCQINLSRLICPVCPS